MRLIMGLDFFLLSFLLLCSGTAADLFFDEPPKLAFLECAGVPFAVGTAGLAVALSSSCVPFISLFPVSCALSGGTVGLSDCLE